MLAQLQDWFGGMTWSDLAGLVILIQFGSYVAIWLWRTGRSWQIQWQHRRPKVLQERRKKRLLRRLIIGKLLRRDEDWDRPEDETRRHRFQGRCRHRSSWLMDPRLSIGRVRPGRRREQTASRGDRVTRIMWS